MLMEKFLNWCSSQLEEAMTNLVPAVAILIIGLLVIRIMMVMVQKLQNQAGESSPRADQVRCPGGTVCAVGTDGGGCPGH